MVGLAVFTLPLIPFFLLNSPWQLVFGVLSSYWPVRAYWSAVDGGAYWPYIAGGLAYNTALVLVLMRLVTRRLR